LEPSHGLFWLAGNTSKRSITLDLESPRGRELFLKLVPAADFVLDSSPPGYLKRLGLHYEALRKVSRKLIMVSITPFGQTGPYAEFQATDLVGMAMGGFMSTTGDDDHPPVRISVPQAYFHAAAEAAVGALVALHARGRGGVGQHVDVSVQESILWTTMPAAPAWDLSHIVVPRSGALRWRLVRMTRFPLHWECKDGYITFGAQASPMGPLAVPALVRWMEEEGYDPGYLKEVDLESKDWTTLTQEEMDRLAPPLQRFFEGHTKEELFQGARQRRIILYPVYDLSEVAAIPQLEARGFWAKAASPDEVGAASPDVPMGPWPMRDPEEIGKVGRDSPGEGQALTYPGPWARLSQTPLHPVQPAPLPGQHNAVVYGELGYTPADLAALRAQGVI
jgi:benzylsuccinate CoA-transferase BbsE subunit